MTTIKWPSDDGNTYYSIIVNPCGYVVLELMGEEVSEKYHDLFTIDIHMRFSMKNKHNIPSTAMKSGRRLLRDTTNHGFGRFNHGGNGRGPPNGGGRGPPGMGGSTSWDIEADKILYPITISRATKNLAAVREFYSSDIGAKEVHYNKYGDGTEHVIIEWNLPTDVGVQMHFW